MSPVASIGTPDARMSPIPVGSPEADVIDVASIGAIPLLMMPTAVVPVVVQIIKAVVEILMTTLNGARGIKSFARPSCARPDDGEVSFASSAGTGPRGAKAW